MQKTKDEQLQKQKLKDGFEFVNNSKQIAQFDEWETYHIKFSIFEPLADPKIDVRLQGNNS
jgi:hypothetical protein